MNANNRYEMKDTTKREEVSKKLAKFNPIRLKS